MLACARACVCVCVYVCVSDYEKVETFHISTPNTSLIIVLHINLTLGTEY